MWPNAKIEKLHNLLKFVKIICQPLKNSVGVFEVSVTLTLFNSFHPGLFNTIIVKYYNNTIASLLASLYPITLCCKDAPWFCVANMPPDVRPEFKSHVNKYRVE